MEKAVINDFCRRLSALGAFCKNFLLVLFCLTVCRGVFFATNWDESFGELTAKLLCIIFLTGIEFDLPVVFVANMPYYILACVSLVCKRTTYIHTFTKCVFLTINTVLLFVSLVDTVFFEYTQRRMTTGMVQEFANETNLPRIFLIESACQWYLIVLLAAMVLVLWRFYSPVSSQNKHQNGQWLSLFCLAIPIPFIILSCFGRRIAYPIEDLDGFYLIGRMDNARQADFAINTPYKLYLSSEEKDVEIPDFFDTERLDDIFPTSHEPVPSAMPNKRNVFVVIVEGLSPEMMAHEDTKGRNRSLTPFLDSLLSISTSFTNTFSNGTVSIDALPAIFSSIPRLKKPYVVSHTANSHIPSLPRELKGLGYRSAFFHGGNNSSMGFRAFAESIGFDCYFGRNEYNADSRFGGDNDFDGTWAVWDERFLQFTALTVSTLSQPFLAGVFTATSHHPFAIPSGFAAALTRKGEDKTDRCVRYMDLSLERFFATARRQPWFGNTIFIITADHKNQLFRSKHSKGHAMLDQFRIPIFIFDPSNTIESGVREGVMQQIDIMPTVLYALGYDRPFVSLGKNALAPEAVPWAFNWLSTPQYIEGNYLLVKRDMKSPALYDYVNDPQLKHNISDSLPDLSNKMTNRVRAIMQRCKRWL